MMQDVNIRAVIGTAGHIDHGKTTLVKALTGRNMDTHTEEIRRGITINPGFTFLELEEGVKAGLIDVPGHERFIKNMIAGASGIDYAMLVVAANDGVKPQTLEHLWILETLGITAGIVALTKCGITDELMTELACDDITETLRGTFLEHAEIVRVDSVLGTGIDELRAKLKAAVRAAAVRNVKARARLHVDRVFIKKGFGAVVTGTLAEGTLTTGDELFLYPSGILCRARGLQTHEATVDKAFAGTRTAINLSGVKASEIKRGDVLSAAEITGSRIIDIKLRVFPKAQRGVAFWDRLRLYIGTRELFCRAVPLSGKKIEPGGEDFCQLRLEDELFCRKDDRFVIRTYSPMETIGGGIVVDANPARHSRINDELLAALSVKEAGDAEDILADYIKGSPGASEKDIAAYAGITGQELTASLNTLVSCGIIRRITDVFFHDSYIERTSEEILAALDGFHAANPLKKGMSKEELRSRVSGDIKAKVYDALLMTMEETGLIKLYGGIAALRDFTVQLTPRQQEIAEEVLAALKNGGFQPPQLDTVSRGDKRYIEIINLLSPEFLIFLDKSTIMHVEYYNKAKDALAAYLNEHGEITLAAFRDLLGTSRKYAQALLEYFDDERYTVRAGDFRRLRVKS